MSNAVTGLLFGVGFGGWIYTMMMRRNGGQVQPSAIVAMAAGVTGFFVVFSLLGIVF
jgi:hypothetical protein